jgi:hypothetical protein
VKTFLYLGVIVAIAAFLVAAAPSGVGSSGDATYGDAVSDDVLTERPSADNWKTVRMKDGTECEGLVFESAEDAEEAALKMGCSGYHEHSTEDGTVLYMPCAIGDKA